MKEIIDFRDDTFFLIESCKLLEQALILNLSHEIFSKGSLSILQLTHNSLINFYEKILPKNSQTSLKEQTRAVLQLNQRFLNLLQSFLNSDRKIGDGSIISKVPLLIQIHQQNQDQLMESFLSIAEEQEDEGHVTEQEMSELFITTEGL